MRRRSLLAASVALASGVARAQSASSVDVLLVLAVDVSRSVTDEEAVLQRDGYRGAITDPTVLAAIAGGPLAAIAIAYVEWASYNFQDLVIPWTRIANASDAKAWADRLAESPRQSVTWTSISGALQFAGKLLASAPFEGSRHVIDVSGDGANNNGPPAEDERDKLVAAGVTINGLPIINRHPRFSRLELDVDKYYQASVIGGPGAFLIVADDFSAFETAIKRKLIQEIAGTVPPAG
ncbi:DUF1194 domain-containing protein [Acidisphaera sp. L21]|uniref:DUF1194 domain-containing protein n=1 Tax=Acidisphaera sp. L21 TaxID=1641851 RepID=UPI00131CFECF|nr:DUF1194 domain-containing protein [Acidisphaera sp. L21]